MNKDEEVRAVLRLIDRLAARFPDRPRAGIERIVWQEHRRLDGRPVRNYVPLLVERAARDLLRGQRGLGDPVRINNGPDTRRIAPASALTRVPAPTPVSLINAVPLKNNGNGPIVPVPEQRRRHDRTH